MKAAKWPRTLSMVLTVHFPIISFVYKLYLFCDPPFSKHPQKTRRIQGKRQTMFYDEKTPTKQMGHPSLNRRVVAPPLSIGELPASSFSTLLPQFTLGFQSIRFNSQQVSDSAKT